MKNSNAARRRGKHRSERSNDAMRTWREKSVAWSTKNSDALKGRGTMTQTGFREGEASLATGR